VSIPLTDYSRFGLWASQFTVEAGEDIRYVARDNATGLPDHDYRMFDSRPVVRMHFDDQSVFSVFSVFLEANSSKISVGCAAQLLV
jgi:hypothetical protein